MGKEEEWKETSYILWHVISGFSNGSESWWHLQVSLKEVLCLIMCQQNIYHLWIWGSRSEGGVLSYQFFIMEIMHVPEQKNKPWSLLDTQLQKYSFKAGRARGLSILRVSNEWEVPLWNLALGDRVRWEGISSLAVSRVVYVKEASHAKACWLFLMGRLRLSTQNKASFS